jgi:CubicO group peptidase (beta-lactamase class C family)
MSLAGALLSLSLAAGGAPWTEGEPAAAGVDPAPLRGVGEQVRSGALVKLTGLLVARHGTLVFERYFGEAGPDALLDTRSATKTLTGYLAGAAIDRKLLPGVSARVAPYFKDRRPFGNPDPRKDRITVEDLLTTLAWQDRKVRVVFMSGNGGNKVGFVPELDLAFVITSNNYNAKGMHEQTERVLVQSVLASVRP